MPPPRECVIAVFTAIGLATSGCAGTHLYRKADHDLALNAQASFTDAKLPEMTGEERKRLGDLLEAELKASRRQILATRDADLLAIVGETKKAWSQLTNGIQTRISALFGTDSIATVLGAYNDADASREQLARDARAFQGVRAPSDPDPTCPLQEPLPSVSAGGKAVFDKYQAECRRYLGARDALAKAGARGSLWLKLHERATAAERSEAEYGAELKVVRTNYEVAKRKYDAAVKGGGVKQLSSAAERFRGALDALGKPLASAKAIAAEKELAALGVADLKLQGLVEALDERRQALIDLLSPAPQAKTPPSIGSAGTQLTRAIAASLPSIDAFLSKGQEPPVTALLLEAENLRLQGESLRKRTASADAQVAIFLAERDAAREEGRWLWKARLGVKDVVSACPVTGDIAADLQTFTPTCREKGLRALAFYENSWSLGRVPENEARYTGIAARHASVLDASDTALARWQNLITVPLSQLVAYHGSGIKPEDVVALLQALGVAGIATGVNR